MFTLQRLLRGDVLNTPPEMQAAISSCQSAPHLPLGLPCPKVVLYRAVSDHRLLRAERREQPLEEPCPADGSPSHAPRRFSLARHAGQTLSRSVLEDLADRCDVFSGVFASDDPSIGQILGNDPSLVRSGRSQKVPIKCRLGLQFVAVYPTSKSIVPLTPIWASGFMTRTRGGHSRTPVGLGRQGFTFCEVRNA